MNQREVTTAATDRIGFFGKVPTHGDFIASGMNAAFQEALDQWLQAGLQMSEDTFGTAWRERFRTMPVWRFVVPRGLWGPATHAGVLLPNSDRVGRSFPLVVVAQLAGYREDPRLLCFDDTWFTAAEALAETSQTSEFDLTSFPAAVKRLRLPYARDDERDEAKSSPSRLSSTSLWWTIDPDTRKARGFSTEATPSAQDFLRLFDVARPAADTTTEAASTAEQPPEPALEQPPEPDERPPLERSYATHPGTRLTVNSDALLLSENPLLFAVADGVGDDARATEAAKMIANALSGTLAQDDLASLVQEVKGKLGRAQGLLQAAAGGAESPQASVVALVSAGPDFAAIWAGDARLYLMRDGTMRALTRDHVEVGLRRRLARSVGGERQLVPEVVIDHFKRGDRILLCSAPLSRTLDERAIAAVLGDTPVADAASTLVQEGLIAGVRDNVSAIVIGVAEE
ncbi:type VI secretion system-associated protein TagF [Mesorhizobium sp. CAU 1732]|uniref:type VI secretion system-associated protein TagF n=1 Tax=Mesorhizobium sp. CAU 1732 TaxID=3140358 RepID=UPI0032601B2B